MQSKLIKNLKGDTFSAPCSTIVQGGPKK